MSLNQYNHKYINVISFDGAIRTLGYVHSVVDVNHFDNIAKIAEMLNAEAKTVDEMKQKISTVSQLTKKKFIDIKRCGVKDLLDGKLIKEVSEVKRLSYLHKFLYKLLSDVDSDYNNSRIANINCEMDPLHIVLEEQWSINTNSNSITSSIITFFIAMGVDPDNIHIIQPSRKNKISFSPDLSFECIKKRNSESDKKPKTAKGMRSKNAKNHTVENFRFYLNTFEQKNIINSIPNGKLEHAADAFMQMYSFIMAEFITKTEDVEQ